MDRKLRNEIKEDVQAAVKIAVQEMMLQIEERYITPRELASQFAMFSPKWLSKYAHLLPRKRVTVTVKGENGTVVNSTHWAYPQHQIAMMLHEGKFDNIEMLRYDGDV